MASEGASKEAPFFLRAGVQYCRRSRPLPDAQHGPEAGKGESGRDAMKNPLDSLWGALVLGVAMTVVLYYLVLAKLGG
jgi:hypothetical protein